MALVPDYLLQGFDKFYERIKGDNFNEFASLLEDSEIFFEQDSNGSERSVILKTPLDLKRSLNSSHRIGLLFLYWTYRSILFAEQNGFDFIELIIESPLNDSGDSADIKESLIKICNNFKIKKCVHAPFLVNNLCSHDQYIREGSINALIKTMNLAKKIDAQVLTFHPGIANKAVEFFREYEFNWFKESLSAIVDEYNRSFSGSFYLSIENMPQMNYIFRYYDEISDILNDPKYKMLSLTLDTSHAWTAGGDDLLNRLLVDFSERIHHIHIVDNNTKDKDPHIPLGTGKIDFRRFFKTLKDINYKANVEIEMPMKEAVLASRDYILNLKL
ncbi:MAG: sugar phosphate isomerase/epimerase family protein [Promethearchaeota archaeon]